MDWCRTGDRPLSETLSEQGHLYASLGLNELRWPGAGISQTIVPFCVSGIYGEALGYCRFPPSSDLISNVCEVSPISPSPVNRFKTISQHPQIEISLTAPLSPNLFCQVTNAAGTASLILLGVNRMAAIRQTTFSATFSWIKMKIVFHFSLQCRLLLRVQLTMGQHWFRQGLVAEPATGHYLNQWWSSLLTHKTIWVTRLQWVNTLKPG